MLHDPGSYSEPLIIDHIDLSNKEKDVLRRLTDEIAGIAALPVHKEKAVLWRKLNDLEPERPMVWINEIPWHEMNVNDELTLQCQDPWARDLETKLRRAIYQWKHMPADMVINPWIECPLAIHSTDFGIVEDVEIARTDPNNDIYSRHFNIQIREPEDIEKIHLPKVTHYEKTTEVTFETMKELFSDVIEVRKVGQTHIWFTPWDYLIRWWGIEEAMIDLVMRPEMVHDAVDRMVDAWMVELDQFEEQNLLSLDCNNTRIGSGGYGYVSDLPGEDFNPERVKPKNMWGCSNAQIFSSVSPEMHWEFAIQHDMRWLSRWGLVYYGCCEPLDKKIDILRRIPNLRKISVSPWNNLPLILSEIGSNYVASIKPNPACFLDSNWEPEVVYKELQDKVQCAASNKTPAEIIMKDISTVQYHPERLWQWSDLVMKVVTQ
ncbi:MAG TPA: hypothetical protein PLT87_06995 [Spirochaetales bacterium]|nr:hypothetical protein [Spirochaetales bacterium]